MKLAFRDPGHAGLSGALLGGLFFLGVYGPHILDPRQIAWLLHGDPAQHYLGFAFFRHAPWTWPPGLIPGLGGGTSLVYTDAIPLLGLLFKPLSPWLPADFQYFGAWMLLCHLLHGAFAARILTRLGCDGTARAAATLLLLSSPALALRAYGHESLMAHWLLLAAIDAWLANRPGRQGLLLCLGALIHPYWLALLAPFALYHWWRAGRPLVPLAGTALLLILLMAAAGYFIARPGQLAAEGYGHYSANLLTFLDPMDWQGFLRHYGRPTDGTGEWSRLLPPLGQATAGQYEGFAYLGAGVLLLLALAAGMALWRRSSGSIGPAGKALTALLPLALVLFLYALSARVTLGTAVLTDPQLPDGLLKLLGIFRSTGRFVWPLALLLPLLALAVLASTFSRRTLALLLVGLCLLQGADLSAKWGEFRQRFASGGLGRLPDFEAPAWQAAAPCRHLVVLPPRTEGEDWIAPALFAARHRQSLNAAYLARADETARQQDEARHRADLAAGRPASGTAYWITDEAAYPVPAEALASRVLRLPVPVGEGGGQILISRESPCSAP
ncbi:DUF6311 domain-containing protein [Denitratisoma oestradiolicum]|uniref:H81 n=1 Tax=Denitratisoma oestradiolicum TaxID=311182 RepID=A0A6S6Y6D9_9PROT|nr:DUF6311 domain-containing protein [Denitratisoma oestradiolicum]TWO80685.1 hypothetical protein CBW56_07915 [Denitratisoma oestradiolicum]CAB1371092.1 H81 [Denitratisoma oestradiolicum]